MNKPLVLVLSLLSAVCILSADKKKVQEITISGNDTMQFDVKNFEVTSGKDVKLTFKNVGKLPKIAMGHNLVILKKGSLLSLSVKKHLVPEQMLSILSLILLKAM